MKKNSIPQLVELSQKGDSNAFELLFTTFKTRLHHSLFRILRNYHETEDIVQQAFLRAWEKIGTFKGNSNFYTWLYRIAVNTAKNHLVSKSRRPPNIDVDIDDGEFQNNSAVLRDNESPQASLATSQMEQVIFRSIENLPSELRIAVTLREFDGLSYEEIAKIMNCPVGTVRSRIFRAREAIEKKIMLMDNN